MFAGVRTAAAGFVAPPPPPPMWSSRLGQCDDAAPMNDWLCAICCTPCASAQAKTQTDNTSIFYNFLCWQPIGVYSWVRHAYGIVGSCGDDMGYGLFCLPCVVRRALTESRVRGPSPFVAGPPVVGNMPWSTSLFACNGCDLCETLCCTPCVTHEIRSALQPSAQPDCCFDALCVLPTAMSGAVRQRYGIAAEFGCLEDIVTPLVCFPCALAQARREVRARQGQGVAIAIPVPGVGYAPVAVMAGGYQRV